MLDERGRSVAEERSTNRSPLTDDDVRALLARASRVLVARGKKTIERPAAEIGLDELKGPSGKYRAPLLRIGDTVLVGFNEEITSAI